MIRIVSGQDAERYSALMEQVYRLRHRVFAAELGQADLAEGLERDQLQRPDAVHHICVRCGRVAGYLCLLPTVGPHSCASSPLRHPSFPRGLDVYELTNYCVAPSCRKESCNICEAGSELIAGFVEWGLACKVSKILVEASSFWVFRALQLKFRVRQLRAQTSANGKPVLATLLEFDAATLEAIRDYRKHWKPVVSFLGEHEARRPVVTV